MLQRYFKHVIVIIWVFVLLQNTAFAYRVYPTTAQDERMFDKRNFPFIAEHADGFNLQHDSFGPFSADQVETIFNQFRNKKFINHGVFKEGVSIVNQSTMTKRPSFAEVTAFMLYNEAPAMNASEWASALSQDVPWPLITHCRAYGEASNFTELRNQILGTSGIMMEFQVTDTAKYDDAASLLKYCVDNDRMVVFLTTFQKSPDVFISAYKEFFYYLKEHVGADYLSSDHVIFTPNTYDDNQVFPETMGYGSTFGVAHWLIDQKTKIGDGYIQPKINFSLNDYFPNHTHLEVPLTVDSDVEVSSVSLYLDGVLAGKVLAAPYIFSGGILNDMTTGYKELTAVASDISGHQTTKAIQIRILSDPIELPGFFQAADVNDYQLRNTPNPEGFIRHVYGNEWIDYQVNVKHAGLYDVKVSIRIQASKQYGGTIILNSATKELGRFTTVTNDPDKDRLEGFEAQPEVTIKNVHLEAGLQTIRATFSHPLKIIRPQFYLYDFKFIKQGSPQISFISPTKSTSGTYSTLDAPAKIQIAATIASPRSEGEIMDASLYIDGHLIATLTSPPYAWNMNNEHAALNHIDAGTHQFRIVATDEKGYTSFEEVQLLAITRNPFNTELTIPGTIKAWEFDMGGEGIGYHDFNEGLERGLSGSQNPRYNKAGNEDVEIEISGGDYSVSGIRNGEWLNYHLRSVQKGTYKVTLTTSANTGKSASVNIWLNDKLIGTVYTLETGSNFSTYKDFSTSAVEITEDMYNANVRLEFTNPNISTYLCFFRKFEFQRTGDLVLSTANNLIPQTTIYPNPVSDWLKINDAAKEPIYYSIYDLAGHARMTGISNNGEIQVSTLIPGYYFIQLNGDKILKFMVTR